MEKEAERKFEDLNEERESKSSRAGTNKPQSSNKEEVSTYSRLDKVRPKQLLLSLSILSSPENMLERSESATIPMREKTGEKKANFHKRAYQLTPTSSLKDVEEGKEGPSDLLQKTSHYFSKRKISEEQISCKNSESSKQSKISVQEEEDILSQPQGHQEKLFSS